MQAEYAHAAAALKKFQRTVTNAGITISALSCHGNPLHPDPGTATTARDTSRKTIRLAEKLGFPVVIDRVLSIEHEDSLMSAEEGLTKAARFLQQIVIESRADQALRI